MSKRIGLADIARKCGLSVSAVSLALRDAGNLPAVTRKRIKATARRLGYRPNPLLASLASKHFRAFYAEGIPLAYLHRREKTPLYSIFPPDFQKLQEYGRRLGFRLEIFHLDEFRSGSQATRVLYSRGVQGIILSPLVQAEMLPGMDWARFSVVGWGESMPESAGAPQLQLLRANVDHFNSVLRAWEEVSKRGYRRIGIALFALRPGSTDDLLRWGAAQACLLNVAPTHRIPPFISRFGLEADSVTDGFGQWLEEHRPDAVIGFNNLHLHHIVQSGYRVPQDIGFASLHARGSAEPPLRPDWEEAGIKEARIESMMAAIDLLDQQIRHHQYGLPRQVRIQLIQPRWVEGETLPDRTPQKQSPRLKAP